MELKSLHIVSFIAMMQIVLLITFLSFGKYPLKENRFINVILFCFLLLISSNIFMTAFGAEVLFKYSYIAALISVTRTNTGLGKSLPISSTYEDNGDQLRLYNDNDQLQGGLETVKLKKNHEI